MYCFEYHGADVRGPPIQFVYDHLDRLWDKHGLSSPRLHHFQHFQVRMKYYT